MMDDGNDGCAAFVSRPGVELRNFLRNKITSMLEIPNVYGFLELGSKRSGNLNTSTVLLYTLNSIPNIINSLRILILRILYFAVIYIVLFYGDGYYSFVV